MWDTCDGKTEMYQERVVKIEPRMLVHRHIGPGGRSAIGPMPS
jgi:hypothetical protein